LTETDTADIATKLAVLRDDYKARIQKELAELEKLERKVRSLLNAPGGESGEALNSLLADMHLITHRLAGSAGTFGFSALGGHARILEHQIDRVLKTLAEGERPPWTAARKNLVALYEEMRRNLDTAQGASLPLEGGSEKSADKRGQSRVAVVEDDPHVGGELLLTLQHFGFDVSLYTRLDAARNAVLSDPPDVIVLDEHFEHESQTGTEWVQAMQPHLRQLPAVIFISSGEDFEMLYRAAAAGGQGYYPKPVNVPRLVARLDQLASRHQEAPYRILIVDDDAELARHFELLLKQAGMNAETLSDPADLLQVLHRFRPDLVLMDVYMPGYSGVTLSRLLRLHDEWLSLPIVYLSGETDLDRQLEAMDIGADDFITKPIADRHFVASVQVRARRARQVSDLIDRDSMTGLLKHARIKEELHYELARARRQKQPLSVVMLDIDHFKGVNDTYGHAVGDLVISALSNLLTQRLRRTDKIGRYGGEEFMVVLPECDAETARGIIDDLREHFAAIPFTTGAGEFFSTISAGIAGADPEGPEGDGEALLNEADAALYQAKGNGRNRVEVAGS